MSYLVFLIIEHCNVSILKATKNYLKRSTEKKQAVNLLSNTIH